MIFFAKIVFLQSNIQTFAGYAVAPYVGAWIETNVKAYNFDDLLVAPYVGAWIETSKDRPKRRRADVAPYVGAWIETAVRSRSRCRQRGRTLCGCVD